MSNSARNPSGPAAMLAGIPKGICRGGLDDLLNNFPKRSISVFEIKGMAKVRTGQRQTPRYRSSPWWQHIPNSFLTRRKRTRTRTILRDGPRVEKKKVGRARGFETTRYNIQGPRFSSFFQGIPCVRRNGSKNAYWEAHGARDSTTTGPRSLFGFVGS